MFKMVSCNYIGFHTTSSILQCDAFRDKHQSAADRRSHSPAQVTHQGKSVPLHTMKQSPTWGVSLLLDVLMYLLNAN